MDFFVCYNCHGGSIFMKNIFIGGVAKSGKSRLATYLCKKYNMNHIPIDYFASKKVLFIYTYALKTARIYGL